MKRNKSKKYWKALMAATLISSVAMVVPVAATTESFFSDVKPGDYYYDAVQNLVERGVIKGFPDETFKPNQDVTRGQAAKIIAGVLGLDMDNVTNPGFSDVSPTNEYYGAIAALANAGIINGYPDGTYKPDAPIERNHMAKIIATAFDLKASDETTTPFTDLTIEKYDPYIKALYEHEITKGNTATTFGGTSHVTRGQLATFITRAESIVPNKPMESNESIEPNESKEYNESIEPNESKESNESNKSDETMTTFKIQSVKDGKLQTSQGTLTYASSLNSIFNTKNEKVLKDAEIKAKVVNGEIESVSSITINATTTNGNLLVLNGEKSNINCDIIVNTDYVLLKNMTVNGNILLSKKVSNHFLIEAVTVNGTLTVSNTDIQVASTKFFADTNSNTLITFYRTSVQRIIIQRNDITIKSDKQIEEIELANIVTSVEIESNVGKITILYNGYTNLYGSGKINELIIKEYDTRANLSKDFKITKLVIPRGAEVQDLIYNYYSVYENIHSAEDEQGKKKKIYPPDF